MISFRTLKKRRMHFRIARYPLSQGHLKLRLGCPLSLRVGGQRLDLFRHMYIPISISSSLSFSFQNRQRPISSQIPSRNMNESNRNQPNMTTENPHNFNNSHFGLSNNQTPGVNESKSQSNMFSPNNNNQVSN